MAQKISCDECGAECSGGNSKTVILDAGTEAQTSVQISARPEKHRPGEVPDLCDPCLVKNVKAALAVLANPPKEKPAVKK